MDRRGHAAGHGHGTAEASVFARFARTGGVEGPDPHVASSLNTQARTDGIPSPLTRTVSKQTRCVMSIIGWIILGLISGFIASKIVNKAGEGFFLDIALGVVGAIVGAFGASGITGFNLYSMIVAIIGAVIVLVVYHAVIGRRVT